MSLFKMDSGGRLQRTSAKISDFKPLPVQVRPNFSNHPLPGRPRPDFPTIIFTQLLSLAEKIKKLGQQENKTFNPGRYTNEIQWVNCLLPVQIDNSGRLGENIII